MKKILGLSLICLLLVGCAGWRANTTNTYTGASFGLKAAVETVKPSCEQDAISIENCDKLKSRYNVAVTSYKSAGNVLILALTTEDAAQKKMLIEQFDTILGQFRITTLELVQLIQEIQALQTHTAMPKKLIIGPDVITIIIAAIEAIVKIAPQIVSWISDWATTDTQIQDMVLKIQAAQAAVLRWE